MAPKILVLGLGRMGLRHVAGAASAGARVYAVSRRAEARQEAMALAEANAPGIGHRAVADASEIGQVDGAIIAGTADVRPDQLAQLLESGIPAILLEKPLCQSRMELEAMQKAAEAASRSRVWVNLPFRTLDIFSSQQCPFSLTYSAGALGIGCNGIHWIDLACHLAADAQPRLLWGEVRAERIASGRGPQFADFGGTALFGFADGSRLLLSNDPESSAPAAISLISGHTLMIFDGNESRRSSRDPISRKPNYLYGQDHIRTIATDWAPDLVSVSQAWVKAVTGGPPTRLPTFAQAAGTHRAMFDLLETTGASHFPIT